MLLLLLIGAGTATPAVRAYGNISFAVVSDSAISMTTVNAGQADMSVTTGAIATEE